ncbi:hypothetical protein M4S82_15650 [Planococcus sp. MERTA32b]|nr:hypothetical protein [Planococcus sp. MER TA 32b]
MESTYLRKWFVVEFVNLDIEDKNEFKVFVEKWMPKYSPLHTIPDELHVPLMFQEIRNITSDFIDFDVLVEHRKVFLKIQSDLRHILTDFTNTAALNATKSERYKINNLVSDDSIQKLNERLEKIRFTLKSQYVDGTFLQVITPDISDFETSLYYNFIQYTTAHPSLLVCAGCKKYISKPSYYQFANARKGYATFHANDFCRQDYTREKDRIRKRKGENT